MLVPVYHKHATTPIACFAQSRKQLISDYLRFQYFNQSLTLTSGKKPSRSSSIKWFFIAFKFPRSQQQASFRVPGDLGREDDLYEEIEPVELVSNNECAKKQYEISRTHLCCEVSLLLC